jgi:hypothetical protein
MTECKEIINNDPLTRGIANKGFRGMRRVVARFNISCNLTGNRPQSLTGHTANVSGNGRTTRKEQETSKENVMTIVFLQNENRHQKFIS